MATRKQNSTGRTIAVIGGGAALAWLLWRGRGKGKGSGSNRVQRSDPVIVRIRSGDQIELDGVSSDLATTLVRARAAGVTRVVATGDARQGWITQVIAALKAAGVTIDATPSLLN
jgi:hypothetical protein